MCALAVDMLNDFFEGSLANPVAVGTFVSSEPIR